MKKLIIVGFVFLSFGLQNGLAHHVLGIGQTGKATEGPQIPGNEELNIGDYFISITVLPGHPVPNQATRVITYTKNMKTKKVFLGEMEVSVASQGLFWKQKPFLRKIQRPIEDRHIQLIEFKDRGTYDIGLGFTDSHGESHSATFELTVGQPIALWKYAVGLLLVLAVGWVIFKSYHTRKRARPV